MINLEIDGAPIAQARPRLGRKGAYNPQAKELLQAKWQLKSQYRNDPMKGPLRLQLYFVMPIPKATSTTKRYQMLHGIIYHCKKPDIDNLAKFALDAMNGIVFVDDSQIVELKCEKRYGQRACTLMNVYNLAYTEKQEEMCL